MLNAQDEEVSPSEFLETANRMGVGNKIDRWVILESIKQLSQHRAKGNNNTKLIINLSRDSLCDESLPPWLGVAFKAAKLPSDSIDRKSTRLNSSHVAISYAVFCLKKKNQHKH